MTTFYKVANNVENIALTANHVIGSGILTVSSTAMFPSSYPFKVSSTYGGNEVIFSITGKTSTTLTIGSVLEGTSDITLPSGTLISMRMTAAHLTDVYTAVNTLETTVVYASQVGSVFLSPTGDGSGLTNINGANVTGTISATILPTSGVAANTYTNATVTVDNKGRVTSASSGSTSGMAIGGTITSSTGGAVLYVSGSNALAQDATSFSYNGSTHVLTTAQHQITFTNTDYTNTAGANSHLLMTNPSGTGQTCVSSTINGTLVAKWRTDFAGNINWVAYSGYQAFYTGGDNGTGTAKLLISNTGNVNVGSYSNIGSVTLTGQFQVDCSAVGKIGIYVRAYSSGQTADLAQFHNGSSVTCGVNPTGDYYLSTTSGQPGDTPKTGTVRIDTINNCLWGYSGSWRNLSGVSTSTANSWTATQTFSSAKIQTHYSDITPISGSLALTINLATTEWQQLSLTSNLSLSFTGDVVGQEFTIMIVQDATGSRTVTWPASVLWPGGVTPTLSTGANKRDVFSFKKIAATPTYLGFIRGQNY